MNHFESICKELSQTIERVYNEGCTILEAERLAARTLSVRMVLADDIKTKDLDARMKKHGVKAIRAKAYMDELVKYDKKPAETFLENAVNTCALVEAAETLYAVADTEKERLEA